MYKKLTMIVIITFFIILLSGCTQLNFSDLIDDTKRIVMSETAEDKDEEKNIDIEIEEDKDKNLKENPIDEPKDTEDHETQEQKDSNDNKSQEQNGTNDDTSNGEEGEAVEVVAIPDSLQVLLNKNNKLPENYIPQDLVDVNIPFSVHATPEKRKLRKEAAMAIESLFADAKQEGIHLLGVSGYRSHQTQTSLFNYYVRKDGFDKASTYSALPGTSEHEAGLAIDVSGANSKCALEICFSETLESMWLEANVAEYGFIIRYPEGKTEITGYQYEPWHLRYVGVEAAKEMVSLGVTLEEYHQALVVKKE